MNYMSNMTIHYGPNSKGIIPYRLIEGMSFLNGKVSVRHSGSITEFECDDKLFEGMRSLWVEWGNGVSEQMAAGNLLPGMEAQLNKELGALLSEGMAQIISNLDTIVTQVGAKSKVLGDIADKYIKLFEEGADEI